MDFRNALAASESGGNYGVVNDLGYTGRYQFGDARLTDFRNATGLNFTMDQFRNDPALQEQAYSWHIADIDRTIKENGLDRYIGQTVGGVPITLDGLRAMAHLGGVGGMTKFVTSGGAYNPADANGTSLSDYAVKFAGQTGNALASQPSPQMAQQAQPRLSDYVSFAQVDPSAFMTRRAAVPVQAIPTFNSLRGA
jgi:hypothetical protein